MDFEFLLEGGRRVVSFDQKDGRYLIRYGERAFEADILKLPDGAVSVIVDGRSYTALVGRDETRILVSIGGEILSLKPSGGEGPGLAHGEEAGEKGSSLVRAPMPGKVIKVSVVENEAVRRNQTLAIVEAMKMENEIKSPREATVRKIFVAAGDLVDADRPLLELESKA